MKTITIHDTNILIDLIELDLLPDFLKLGFEFHTTDFVMDEVIKSIQRKKLKQFKSKFTIKNFDTLGVMKLAELQNTYKALSIEDISVMELSRELKGVLCTGDSKLKSIAESRGIEVHGVLWVVAEMVKQKILDAKVAIKKLEELKSINPRINKNLIDKEINIILSN